jgi:hypothetical protein
MITISIIMGLYMIISLIIVSIKYLKNPKDELIGALFNSGFFIHVGSFLGLAVILTAIIMLALIFLP